jgi:hypothetical protein
VAAAYGAAFDASTLVGADGRDLEESVAAIAAILPGLQGNWVRADILTKYTPVLKPEFLEVACEASPDRLVQTYPLGFEVQRLGREGDVKLHVRYGFVGQINFVRSYDEVKWLT